MRMVKSINGLLVLLLVLASLGVVVNATLLKDDAPQSSIADTFVTTQLPLTELPSSDGIEFGAQTVTINGEFVANGTFVLSPSSQPSSAVAGQLYYDQTGNVLSYFNGTKFVSVLDAAAGGVTTIQGAAGSVTLNAGNGIGINGTTITNTGVINLLSANTGLIITDEGNGNRTLAVSPAIVTLQGAYDAGNTITTSSNRDIIFNVTETATSANVLVNLQCDTNCGTNGRFAVQDDGVDVFSVSPDGTTSIPGLMVLSNPITDSSFSFRSDATNSLKITSNIIGNASNDGGSDTNTNYIQSSVFNSGTGGTIDSVRVCFTNVDPTDNGFRVAVYSDNAGAPDALLSTAAAVASPAAAVGWNTASLGTTVTLAPNTNYWLGFSMQVGGTMRYCRQDGGTTKYQGGFAWMADFPATYNVTDITSTTVAAYAPYLTITDDSFLNSAIKITENNEVGIRPLYNSDTAFEVLRRDGTTTFSVNNLERYAFAAQMMVGGVDVNYTSFLLGNQTSGVLGARRTTNVATNSIMELLSDVGGASTVQLRVLADGTMRLGNQTVVDATGALLMLDSITADPAVTDGAMYYNATSRTMRCAQGSIWISCVGGLVAVNTSIPAGNIVANTAAETNFASNWNMPADYCTQGRTIRWTAQGTYSTTGTPSLTLRLKGGTTTLAATPAVTTGSGVTDREWRIEGQTICNAAPAAAAATETQGFADIFAAATAATSAEMVNTATTNLATNGALTLQISAQWGAADPANTITLRQFIVEAIGP